MRSSPATFFRVSAPVCTISPVPSTAVTCWTWSAVTPYFAQHMPPALVAVARFPPIVEMARLPGSGAYHRPCSAAALSRSPLRTPACTRAERATGSMAMMRSRRASTSTMHPSIALAAPASPCLRRG